jgi:hypothetical protein
LSIHWILPSGSISSASLGGTFARVRSLSSYHRLAKDLDLTRIGFHKIQDHLDGAAFARTIGPDQTQDLARGDRKGQIPHRGLAVVGFIQMVYCNRCHLLGPHFPALLADTIALLIIGFSFCSHRD